MRLGAALRAGPVSLLSLDPQRLIFSFMLSTHHLVQLIPLRVESGIRRLQGDIWVDMTPLDVQATAAGPALISCEEAAKLPLRPVSRGTFWGKLFDQRWCKVTLPAPTKRDRWFSWKDQGEATLYIDGKPYFGFDVAHRFCRLPAGVRELWIEANCVQSAIWHGEARGLSSQGSFFEGAFLGRRNDDAWNTFHDLKCLFDTSLILRQQENVYLQPQVAPGSQQPPVDKHSPAFRRMLRLMDEAVDTLDNEGIAATRKQLAAAYKELRADKTFMQCVITGHAHIDLVWLWPERIGELKAVHTFSTVNRLMDEYPEFRFAYSQPASYEAVNRRSPALFKNVKKRIRSGKWEATGAMYVESDTLIACGEALLRSFTIGQEVFTGINGKPCKLTWLPDVFGYSACLPQMMNMAGVSYFFTTKMTWNMVNRFPYSSFIWRGNDGSDVIAHVTQDCGYNTQMEVPEIKASMWGHQQGDIHGEYLLPTGYGDGGGGPTAEMCERARRLGGLPGMPAIKWGQPEDFFSRLEPLRKRLPVYKGECYLEGHRGTYTTHSQMKAAFRGLERALQVSEAVSCVTSKPWDRTHPWKRLVFSQFHDFIPGSSVWDVYLEGVPELNGLARAEYEKSTDALSEKKGGPCLFNPHAVPVSKWVKDPESKKHVHVRLPALGGSSIITSVADAPSGVEIKGATISNGLAEFRLDKKGWIDRLVFEGNEVPLNGPAGQLMFYKDQPARYEAWDLDRQTLARGEACADKAQIEIFKEGKHRAGFRVKRDVGTGNSAEVTFYLEAGSPLLHVSVDLDWQEPHSLLKFFLPTSFAATNARFGIPYSSVLRSQVVNGPTSEAMWEVPFSRWLAVFDESEREGLFAITENKYGATVRDGAIGISLVRSPHAVGFDGMRIAWPPNLARVEVPSPYTDIGRHSIHLAFGKYHAGLVRENHPASLADTLFTDPVSYTGNPVASPIESMTGGESLIPAWSMPVDDSSWLLRLHEAGGQRGSLQIKAASGWKIASCDAKGKPDSAPAQRASLEFTPHKIVNVLFKKQKPQK